MTLPRPARALVLPAVAACLLAPHGYGQKTVEPPTAQDLLKPKPRPKKAPLPRSRLPLEFVKNERIALVGNSLAERMSLFGHFETLLHLRHPDKELVVRNFGRPADEVGVRQRSADYTHIDDPLYAFNPDTFICFFGFNESFKGPEGVEKFKADYERFLDETAAQYPRDDAKSPPRFVLVSPVAFEATGEPFQPDGKAENANLRLYADAVKAVAEKRKLAFVDLFTPTLAAFAEKPGAQYTVNGCHLNEAGDRLTGDALGGRLFTDGDGVIQGTETSTYHRLRDAVVDKAFVHQQDYRMVNGWYVYGGRRTYDTETFPREYAKLRAMAAVRDRYVWDLAQGKPVAEKPDDSKTGDLHVPPTRFGQPGQKYSEAERLRYLSPEEFVKSCKVPDGFEIQPFADEGKFPEIAKPVQMNFDGKGRLWLACMPNYPQWKPGDPPPNDKLVILEDTDGDGKADKSTVFYDELHCPTGFEFWNGGVLVMSQPRVLWLKDTDGDDKADLVVHLFDGWASDDTHHRGGWEWSPAGRLHLLEGIAMSTTLETPWGPHRSQGQGGTYVIDPRSLKVRQFALPGMYNMWCYVFDEWGNGIVGDGTTPNQTWDTTLSGAQYPGRKGVNFILPNGERPNLGNEFLVSRHFPPEVQKQFVYAAVITMNGLPRYDLRDDGAGFMGKRLPDLIKSSDKHFRPADPQIGPDGALWFGDWANALIGHMQYSQRDPSRDHTRGRVYRLVAKGRPLLKPVTQHGKSVEELIRQLGEYEWRTRYRARRELRDRPAAEVLRTVNEMVVQPIMQTAGRVPPQQIKEDNRLLCEALWLQASFHAVDPRLLKFATNVSTPEARAAAVRVAADERDYLPAGLAFDLLKAAAVDDFPRARAEALRGLSFYGTPESVAAMLEAAKKPLDYWTQYILDAALGANEPVWRGDFLTGKLGKDNPAVERTMTDILSQSKAGGAAAPHLRLLLGTEKYGAETRNKAMTALGNLKGNATTGREVFVRSCTACHKVGNGDGQEYGPNLRDVGKRLTRAKLVESIVDPNAEVEAKYASTRVVTLGGKTVVGLLVSEDKKQLVIFDGKEKQVIPADDVDSKTTLKQSSMPEGQAGAMSPAEFVDLIEYLAAQKQ